jgi:Fe/S biogenesis protein NfuA
MITITDNARSKLIEIMQAKNQHGSALRLRITGRGNEEFNYDMRFVDPTSCTDGDAVIEFGELRVLIDEETGQHIAGTVIDFRGLTGGGLSIDNPNPVWEDATAAAVAQVIAKQINPGVKAHGGRIDLVDVRENVAYITMNGGCQGCGVASMTLKMGVERQIREGVPQIQSVIDTTDHTQGKKPFFHPAMTGQSPFAGG